MTDSIPDPATEWRAVHSGTPPTVDGYSPDEVIGWECCRCGNGADKPEDIEHTPDCPQAGAGWVHDF